MPPDERRGMRARLGPFRTLAPEHQQAPIERRFESRSTEERAKILDALRATEQALPPRPLLEAPAARTDRRRLLPYRVPGAREAPMGKVFDGIDETLAAWLGAQHVFFVATAPRGDAGHVNVSPKGLASFAILGPREVAYLDLVGSGAETIAHLRDNRRITLMFCAFEGLPRIVRLYGRGEAIEPGDPGFAALAARFPRQASTRAVIRVELARIADSCGYGVPLLEYKGERSQLADWAERKGAEGLRAYQLERNRASIDGLPALRGETLRG